MYRYIPTGDATRDPDPLLPSFRAQLLVALTCALLFAATPFVAASSALTVRTPGGHAIYLGDQIAVSTNGAGGAVILIASHVNDAQPNEVLFRASFESVPPIGHWTWRVAASGTEVSSEADCRALTSTAIGAGAPSATVVQLECVP
jgi:hypothetical protein